MVKKLLRQSGAFLTRSRDLGLLISLLACCGCGGKSIVPSVATGRKALETALTAWQEGKPDGKFETTSPQMQVADEDWLKGKKLESYEILSEETDQEGYPWFSVRLHFAKPQSAQEVRYMVKGGTPLWILREEQLKQSVSWHGYKKK